MPRSVSRADRLHVDGPALDYDLVADLEARGRREFDAVRRRPSAVRDRHAHGPVRGADGPKRPDLPGLRLARSPAGAGLDSRHPESPERLGQGSADREALRRREAESPPLARRPVRDDDIDVGPGLRRGDERVRPVAFAAAGDPFDSPPHRTRSGPEPQDPVRGLAAARLAVEPPRRDRHRGRVLGHGVSEERSGRSRSFAPGMGLPEFESGSRAPKARRMDQ